MLFKIQIIMSTRFKYKNHAREACFISLEYVLVLSPGRRMMSRDQLWYVMKSSASHGDALILSGTDDSIRGIII